MKIGHAFNYASGMNKEECHVLAYRYEEETGFQPDAGESYVLQFHAKNIAALVNKQGWLTALWRSPSGKVYVTDANAQIFFNPDPEPRKAPWQTFDLQGALTGVWGLDDKFVLAWGQAGKKYVIYRWDGSKWKPMDSPGEVVAIHGIRPNFIYAVGTGGLIARWDGSKWNTIASPARGTLSSVFVASEDQIYACGRGKELLEGSVNGWSKILDHTAALACIAKWQGAIWVGSSGSEGLSQLDGNKLVSLKPNIKATVFDVRGALVISASRAVIDTSDGKNFSGTPADVFAKMKAGTPPMWKK